MSNDVTANPWKLDTTGAITAATVRVERIRWVGGTTAGHTVSLHDAAGKIIVSFVATAANYTEDVPIRREYTGLTLTTLASGIVYVSIAQRPKSF